MRDAGRYLTPTGARLLAEISGKVAEIVTHGWEEADRGDPWLVLFRKGFPDTVDDPIAELREVMGDYWLTDEAQALLRSK